jgi:hypothetical protein
MTFDDFAQTAWADHATDASGVAARLADGLVLVADEPQLLRLAGLAQHVLADHLGDWAATGAFVERLTTLPAFAAEGASGQSIRRIKASLVLCEEPAAALSHLAPSDVIRAQAMAASALTERAPEQALRLLAAAIDQAEASGLPADDPMNRALAMNGNNIASTLEQKPTRSDAERALMILAAQTSRRYWERAGGWLEIERAEYRLAMTWLAAGDPIEARRHAQTCLEIVEANQGAPIERLFGWEALGRIERAAGNRAGHALALARARDAFTGVDEADKAWCAESLSALAAYCSSDHA